MRLPSEGEDGWTETGTWHDSLCDGVEVTLDAASDSRTIEYTMWVTAESSEGRLRETLAVFPDAQAAVAFMTSLEQDAHGCGPEESGSRGSGLWVNTWHTAPLQGGWGRGLVVWRSRVHTPASEHNTLPDGRAFGGDFLLAVRNGNAVAISDASIDHAGLNQVDPEHRPNQKHLADLREPLDEIAPALCRFAEAGC